MSNAENVVRPAAMSVESFAKRNGAAIGRAESSVARLKAELIANLAPLRDMIDGKPVTKDDCKPHMKAMRAAWIAGYQGAKDCDDAAARKAWSRYSDPTTETIRNETDNAASKATRAPHHNTKASEAQAVAGGGVVPGAVIMAAHTAKSGKGEDDVLREEATVNLTRLATLVNKYAKTFDEPDLKETRELIADLVAFLSIGPNH